MTIGKITGPMLFGNLERQGTNLSIDATAYFDVNNYRLGVNTNTPLYTLDVNGNARIGNVHVFGNTIFSDTGFIGLGAISSVTITGGSANYIVRTDGNGNLSFVDLNSLPEAIAINANISGANAAIITANTAVVGYVNTLNSAMTANVTAANLAITGANAAIVSANTAMQNYVDTQISSVNSILNIDVIGIASNIAGANAAIVTANLAMQNYVNTLNSVMASNVAGANAAIITANTAVVGYVNTLNSAMTANVTAANLAINNLQSFTINLLGNAIPLGANSAGTLVSNAVSLTTSTYVTDSIAQLNYVLGKLVPPSPPSFPGTPGTISLTSSTANGLMCNFTQTDNSGWGNLSVAGGTNISAVRNNTYSVSPISSVGPGNSGTVNVYLNGKLAGTKALAGSSNGTYGNLVISNNQDYHNVVSTVTAGFWSSFDATAYGSNIPAGWNRVLINDTATNGNTNTVTWYYDSSTPGTPTFSNTSIAITANSVAYSSTIPHLTTSAQFALKGNVSHLSGDMYPNSTNLISSTGGGGAFYAPGTVTYSSARVATPLARNLYVSSGSAYFETTTSIGAGFGSDTGGPSVTVDNNYASASATFSPGATVLYKTGTSNQIEETALPIGSVGAGSGVPFRIVNPGPGNTPSYTGSESAFNSQTSQLQTYDATVVAAVLKFDQTNYSTGYLPVGPNLSGQGTNQYFTFKFVRSSVSKFNINYTGTIAGLWVALPGSVIDTASTLNGWLDMSIPYAGSGVPGVNTNGSNGCALGVTASLGSNGSYGLTATFGTASSSNTSTNEIYVRIKLTSGQSVSALSIQAATN